MYITGLEKYYSFLFPYSFSSNFSYIPYFIMIFRLLFILFYNYLFLIFLEEIEFRRGRQPGDPILHGIQGSLHQVGLGRNSIQWVAAALVFICFHLLHFFPLLDLSLVGQNFFN